MCIRDSDCSARLRWLMSTKTPIAPRTLPLGSSSGAALPRRSRTVPSSNLSLIHIFADAEAEKNYLVSGIYERDRHLLEFLEGRGIRPGARVHVAGRNYDRTLTLTTDAGTVALGQSAAEKVWVRCV